MFSKCWKVNSQPFILLNVSKRMSEMQMTFLLLHFMQIVLFYEVLDLCVGTPHQIV